MNANLVVIFISFLFCVSAQWSFFSPSSSENSEEPEEQSAIDNCPRPEFGGYCSTCIDNAFPHPPPPNVGFAVFVFNTTLPAMAFTVDGEPFYRTKLNYTAEQIEELKNRSIEYFSAVFGINNADQNPNVMLALISTSPAADTRAVVIACNQYIPPLGFKVYDGAYLVTVINPQGLDLGGRFTGTHVPAGTSFNYGHWYIERVDKAERLLQPTIFKIQAASPGALIQYVRNATSSGVIDVETESGYRGQSLYATKYEFLANGNAHATYSNVIRF